MLDAQKVKDLRLLAIKSIIYVGCSLALCLCTWALFLLYPRNLQADVNATPYILGLLALTELCFVVHPRLRLPRRPFRGVSRPWGVASPAAVEMGVVGPPEEEAKQQQDGAQEQQRRQGLFEGNYKNKALDCIDTSALSGFCCCMPPISTTIRLSVPFSFPLPSSDLGAIDEAASSGSFVDKDSAASSLQPRFMTQDLPSSHHGASSGRQASSKGSSGQVSQVGNAEGGGGGGNVTPPVVESPRRRRRSRVRHWRELFSARAQEEQEL